jgi:hypothetical protein
MVSSVVVTGGWTALLAKKDRAKNGVKKSVEEPKPKEETWDK